MSIASPHSAHLSNEPTTSCDAPSLPGSTSCQHVSSLSDEERKRDNNSSYPPEARSPAERNSLRFDGIQNAESKSSGQEHQENSADNEDKSRDPPQAMLSDVLNRLDRMEGTLFGLKKTRFAPQGYADNYEQKYEPDELYEETGPNARIWRVYMDETATFDRDMIEEMRDALDVLLVFAALFSAIITTFVAQTSQQLSQDFTQMTALLVYESIQTQKALANGTALSSVYQSPMTPLTPFTPDSSTVWVNGLWFMSLTLSLIAALAAVLVKQWLRQYMTLPSGTVRERAVIRHFRYMGFQTWQVAGIVGSLPILVHVSVGAFLVGIIVFLLNIQLTIAIVTGAISGAGFILYGIVNVIPVFSPSCPYRTPISDFAYWIHYHLTPTYFCVLNFLKNLRRKIFPSLYTRDYSYHGSAPTLKLCEKRAVTHKDNLLIQAIFWLYNMSSNPTVRSTAMQAAGGLPDGSHPVTLQPAIYISFSFILAREIEAFNHCGTLAPIDKSKLECLLRAWCFCMFPPNNLTVIPQIQNMFDRHENGYAITLLLPTNFHSNWQQLSMIEDLMRDNILGTCTHRLTTTMWNLLLHKLKLPLKIESSNETFSFLWKILSDGGQAQGKALTLAEHLCRSGHTGSNFLFLLPELRDFPQFCVQPNDPFRNTDAKFIFAYWLLLCHYDRLNRHAQGNYEGVDLHKECDHLSELGKLAQNWRLAYPFQPSLSKVPASIGNTIFTPWDRYQSFLETVLTSSAFWDIHPSCEPELLESICTLKAEIKTTFSTTLNRLKGFPLLPPRLAQIGPPNPVTEVDGIQEDLEKGLIVSSELPNSQSLASP